MFRDLGSTKRPNPTITASSQTPHYLRPSSSLHSSRKSGPGSYSKLFSTLPARVHDSHLLDMGQSGLLEVTNACYMM